MELASLAVLQRLQPAKPPQLARRQRLARQQVPTRQAQQQARRQVRRRQDQPLRTPQKGGEHTRVRPPQPEPQRSKRGKQLLRAFPSEPVNERRVRNKSRRSQLLRQVVAAKPERDLKVRKLRQSRPLLVKRQPGRSVARRVSARLSLRRNLRETNNKFRYLDFTANQPGTSERRAFLHPTVRLCRSAFYGGGIGWEIFHAQKPCDPRRENNCGHKQKRHMHVRVSSDVTEQPKRLHIPERVDHENVRSKRRRADGRQRNVRESRV